ncbi:MAG: hypothetical protein KGL77_06835 [Actinomycetales bacterium]|nr:hypothetical protein [Actinomycetales bacterium]
MAEQFDPGTGRGRRIMRFRRWFGMKNAGEKLGFGCLGIAVAIPAVTLIWLLLQSILEGGCTAECVNRGWAGVIAFFIAVPIGVVGLVIFLISAAVKQARR